jgi:ABC-type uncharacterized transport system involved in gliding motility auxiliary subunit
MEGMTMRKEQIALVLGILGLVLFGMAILVYGVNTTEVHLIRIAWILGSISLVASFVLGMGALGQSLRSRTVVQGTNMALMIVFFLAIVASIQFLATRHSKRFDLTRNKRFSLAPQTLKILDSLDVDVQITGFFRKGSANRAKAHDLYDQYAHRSHRVHYELIDPDQRPQMAIDLGVTSYGTTVVRSGEKKELLTELTEEALTNAIVKVTRKTVKAVYFVKGHGERMIDDQEARGYSIAKQAIEKDNYRVESLSLMEVDSIPDDAYVLVVADPRKDFLDAEMERLREFLQRGRAAVFMVEPFMELPNLERLFEEYRIGLDDDIVVDPVSRLFGTDATVPVATAYERHPITKGFNVATFFPTARSVRIVGEDRLEVTPKRLVYTGRSAWGETDLETYRQQRRAERNEGDMLPPVALAAVSSRQLERGKDAESRILVFGDADFASNSSFRVSGNGDLFLNAVNYLAEEKDLVAIRPKQGLGDRLFLTSSQASFIKYFSLIFLPFSVIFVGAAVYWRNAKRG